MNKVTNSGPLAAFTIFSRMRQAYLLFLEGSGAYCSAAVSEGDRLLSLEESDAPFVHTEQATLLIQAAVERAGTSLKALSAVVVSDGPGSYTSLRVSTSTAKGICYALQKPLIALPSLYTLAYGMQQLHPHCSDCLLAPMIDARRQDVYLAWYTHDLVLRRAPELATLRPALTEFAQDRPVLIGGSGEKKAVDLLGDAVQPTGIRASAGHMIAPGWQHFRQKRFAELATYAPRYITSPNITVPRKKL
jgi:tRNA threonylcarbamoyladenosine biosynthesis protein TsaB